MRNCRTIVVFQMNAAAWFWYFAVFISRSAESLAQVVDYPAYPDLTPGLSLYCPGAPGQDFNTTSLDSIKLPCADSYLGKHRSGTTSLYRYPKSNCSVKFELDSGCSDTYAIYFNIKHFNLPLKDSVKFYENDIFLREIHGGQHESASWPSSVAQVLSTFSRSPSLKFVLEKDEFSVVEVSHAAYITLDYTVVRGGNRDDESFCPALSGYVPDLYFCDVINDRVNCPSTYDSSLVGLNGANQTQIRALGSSPQCIEKTTIPYHSSSAITPTDENRSTKSWVYVATYIILVVVLVSPAVIFLIYRTCFHLWNSEKAARTGFGHVTSGRASVLTANVSRARSTVGSPLPGSDSYMSAPPAYTTVFPAGPSPDPPKYESV